MKKTISFLLALVFFLLTACGQAPRGSETESGESLESEDTTAGAEPYVLKTAPEDQNQAAPGSTFVETPEGYYYVCGKETPNGFEYFINFCPRGGDRFRPLCGKPNCSHNDKNCNAWCGHSCLDFGYYNGGLYTVEVSIHINVVRMNLDGTDHRVVATLDESVAENFGLEFKFHHGKLFIWETASSDLPLEEQEEQEEHLVVLDLTDYSQKELASDFLRTASLPPYYKFYKDKLYMRGTGEKETYGDYDPYKRKLIEVDAVTGEAGVVLPRSINGLYVTDSTWYFFEPDLTSRGYKAENVEPGFREYDPESGTIQDKGLPTEDILNAFYDEDFIYAGGFPRNNDRDQTLYFLSRDYKLLDRIELSDIFLYAVASDRVYFYGRDLIISHYIDKSQIGSGELTLVPIKTVG